MRKIPLEKIYYYLLKIRRFEEKICELYPQQEIHCPVHLYIGQEAIAVGVCLHLKRPDYVFSNHRNHGHFIAKGASLAPLFAELYGRATGCSKGKGGSMHMVSRAAGILGTSAIVAGGLPIALGAALASKMKREQRVSVVFFGDGAVDEGSFYESLNFAALHKLPLVFVCENNFYATNSPQKARQVNPEIYQLAGFFKLPSSCLDGNDVLEVYQAAGKYIAAARRGQGPALIEARTYRWKTHVGPETDIEKNFRDKVEVEEWFKKCPLKKFRESTLGQGLLKEPDLEEIEARVKKEIAAALAFALKSPYPKAEALLKDVY